MQSHTLIYKDSLILMVESQLHYPENSNRWRFEWPSGPELENPKSLVLSTFSSFNWQGWMQDIKPKLQ